MLALCQCNFWVTGQYEITDVMPVPVTPPRHCSLHATGAILATVSFYLQVTSHIWDPADSFIASSSRVLGQTHTQQVFYCCFISIQAKAWTPFGSEMLLSNVS